MYVCVMVIICQISQQLTAILNKTCILYKLEKNVSSYVDNISVNFNAIVISVVLKINLFGFKTLLDISIK